MATLAPTATAAATGTPVVVVAGSWSTSVDSKSGEYKRKESQFRNWINKDGEFPPEAGRYHLVRNTRGHLAGDTRRPADFAGLSVLSVRLSST